MITRLLFSLALVAISSSGTHAHADQELVSKMRIYEKAEPVERAYPSYPRQAQRSGNEGWVVLSFVIDETGQTANPIVVDSAGSSSFEAAAKRALLKSSFKPATLNGEPVESCDNQYKYTFAMGGKAGASRAFIKQYKRAIELLETGDFEAVKAIIDQAPKEKNYSHYEDNWLQLLRSKYFAALGDTAGEYDALEQGFAQNGPDLTTLSVYRAALFRLTDLSLAANDYSKALVYANRLQQNLLDDPVDSESNEPVDLAYIQMSQAVNSVISKLNEVNHWSTELTVGERGFFSTPIARSQFTLQGDMQPIREVQLRCDAKRLEMPIDTDITVDIPEHWGQCMLYVHGQEGASLKVVQHTVKS